MATATAPGYRTSYHVPAKDKSGEHEGDMEGTTHAATGALLGAGVALLSAAGHSRGVPVYEAVGRDLLYGALTAGFALLPDADHPRASFAYSAGPVSHGIAHLVAVLFGGHRQGMHSLFGIGVVALGTESCAVWWPNNWALGGLAFMIMLCTAAGLCATGFARHPHLKKRRSGLHLGGMSSLFYGGVLAAVAVADPLYRPDLWWLAAMGMALHIFEDEFTGHGCGLLWPLTRKRFGGDGHQPAKGAKAPKTPYREARDRAARPVTPRAPSAPRPSRRPVRGPVSMCPHCWVGECESCKGQGCKCPQPATSHPGRAPVGKPPVPSYVVPDPADDLPPF